MLTVVFTLAERYYHTAFSASPTSLSCAKTPRGHLRKYTLTQTCSGSEIFYELYARVVDLNDNITVCTMTGVIYAFT